MTNREIPLPHRRWWLAAVLLACLVACAPRLLQSPWPELAAEPWHQAEALFRRDAHWHGGDGASSVDLGAGRILWLFGDSFICDPGCSTRAQALLVRNSVALQQGSDPRYARVSFHWGERASGVGAFFDDRGPGWLWPVSGIRLGEVLLVFLMHILPDTNPLGFRVARSRAILIDNPDETPGAWNLHPLELPQNDFGVALGSGALIREGDHVYAFGTHRTTHDIYLVRWRETDARQGALGRPEWWAGPTAGWQAPCVLRNAPVPLFSGGQMEFSVHYDRTLRHYVQVQADPFGTPGLRVRFSQALSGPWSPAARLYEPPQLDRSGLLVYAGKAHPALSGAGMVCTYAVNAHDYAHLVQDPSIYYPLFVRVSTRRSRTGGP